jgi:hypothetical protein
LSRARAAQRAADAPTAAGAAGSRCELPLVSRAANAAFALATAEGVDTLRRVLEHLAVAGCGARDRTLRNEALAVATLLARSGQGREHVRSSGLLQLLVW